MTTPKKENLFGQNLYVVPECTICRQELISEITSLACGHCFHYLCITQHFQYRGTCPNCQKRACLKEVRGIIFQLQLNTKSNSYLQNILLNLSTSQKGQMQQLLRQVQIASEQSEKFKNQSVQNQKELKAKMALIQSLKVQNIHKKSQIQQLRKEILQLCREKEALSIHLMDSERSEASLKTKLDKLEEHQKQFQQFRKYKKIMQQNSETLQRFKADLQSRQTPHADMARQFFQICQMCKLEEGKMKQNLKGVQAQLKLYCEQISKLKQLLQRKEKDLARFNERMGAERKRADENETKYRRLKDKYLSAEEKEDSNQFSNISRKPTTQPPKLNLNISSKEEIFEPSMDIQVRKPSFGTSLKIGGLGPKKKDDKIRIKY